MTLNIVFFRDYEECVYACDDHMPAGMDDPTTTSIPACVACQADMDLETCALGVANLHPIDDARICGDEDMPGVATSLVNVAIVLPIYLTLSSLVSAFRAQALCIKRAIPCIDMRYCLGGPVSVDTTAGTARHTIAQRRRVGHSEGD